MRDHVDEPLCFLFYMHWFVILLRSSVHAKIVDILDDEGSSYQVQSHIGYYRGLQGHDLKVHTIYDALRPLEIFWLD